jgi:Ca2+-transporting ATPase
MCVNKRDIYKGLTREKVKELQDRYGKNELTSENKHSLLKIGSKAVCEPIFLLLMSASVVYFLLGEAREGIIMIAFVTGVVIMDIAQEAKTDKAIRALNKLAEPAVRVYRNGQLITIPGIDLVPGDIFHVEEGSRIPADGYLLYAHDFCVDESLLTGESGEVWKTAVQEPDEFITHPDIKTMEMEQCNYCFAGTLVIQGNADVVVQKTGKMTAYGRIGTSLTQAKEHLSPLQIQMRKLTKTCTGIAFFLFLLVSAVTFYNLSNYNMGNRLVQSFLAGIVLSLSMIPAEFPVILTVFLSMGSLRLMKKHGLIRRLHAVETLGAISVICIDKTGTITQNQMTVTETWAYQCSESRLIGTAKLASDIHPHEAMDKAILKYYEKLEGNKNEIYTGSFLMGYPFSHDCKTMAHVWKEEDNIWIAAKGSPEWLVKHCNLSETSQAEIESRARNMTEKGLRVIGVGSRKVNGDEQIPDTLQECEFTFLGLLGFMDPLKENIDKSIGICYEAGIRVIMITGDNGNTAAAIAKQLSLQESNKVITGSQISTMTDEILQKVVRKVNIFARVVPEQKQRIVKALQMNGELVAMTGDGVNDAIALKYADIGIAMGKSGSEVTREAADLVLLDDNFATIIESIQDGRRIYLNIRKAISYVFAIHIPIAFICLLGPMLGIHPENLMLLPLHVVLLELIMNPTCSTMIERQPADGNCMKKKPRNLEERLLSKEVILKSFLQGGIIFAASFSTYYYLLKSNPLQIPLARTAGLSIIIVSNLVLLLVNCSETEYTYQSIAKMRKDKGIILAFLATILLLFTILFSPVSNLLLLKPLDIIQFIIILGGAILTVLWYDFMKMIRNRAQRKLIRERDNQ